PVWRMKTSAPRIDSSYRQYVSPLAKVSSVTSPSSTPSCSAIRAARTGCERPANTISRFCGPRSIQWPGFGSSCGSFTSSPGSASSVVPVAGCIAFLVLLARASNRERVRWDVLGDHRSGRCPCTVSDLHRGDETILDPGPDVLADLRAALRHPLPMWEVRGDRAGADVRVLADLGVADVGEVRNLRPLPHVRVLDLDEGARFGI